MLDVHHSPLDATIIELLVERELLVEGHFAYPSGRHSSLRVDRDRLLADPAIASRMGYAVAKRFFTDHLHTVATPSIWGAGLAQWVAYFLDPKARVAYATPVNGVPTVSPELTRLIEGQRVLLVDNLIITGETMAAFNTLIEDLGGEVIGVAALWNESGPEIAGHPVFGLLNTLDAAYPPEECPICRENGPPVEEVPY